ncbi:hypothetical protein BKA69DRAFT_1168544 [Paraphysoderma sedebokerense]|nr:hypothetical protein BKA69DRAFT_1168544 [Paraphysoderma sedebokerense]
MSAAAKVTLAAAIVFTVTSVVGVHYQQIKERERMHLGVINDEKRQEMKKRQLENTKELEMQQKLQAELLKDPQDSYKSMFKMEVLERRLEEVRDDFGGF